MPDVTQLDLRTHRLTSELSAGILRLDGLNELAVGELTHHAKTDDDAVSFSIRAAAPDDPLVWAAAYRLPFAQSQFDQDMDFYLRQRKKWAKLPDGPRFEPSMFAPVQAPPDWTHDAFPIRGRSLVHIYTSPAYAVCVRYVRRQGNMLDVPLFRHVADHLRFDISTWRADPPAIDPRR